MNETNDLQLTNASNSSARVDGPRQTLTVAWAESEFFQVWLKLARTARGETTDNACCARG
jgi:hypothetical protein